MKTILGDWIATLRVVRTPTWVDRALASMSAVEDVMFIMLPESFWGPHLPSSGGALDSPSRGHSAESR